MFHTSNLVAYDTISKRVKIASRYKKCSMEIRDIYTDV